MMPQMDGLHILDLIKADPNLEKIKVIMLTALSDDHIKEEADRFGACDFIVKAESGMEDVLKKVDKALSHR
jgi:CheY-like chemotaxis protein